MALTKPTGFTGVYTSSNASTNRIKPNVVHPLLTWQWAKNSLALFSQKNKKGASKSNGETLVWYESLTPPLYLNVTTAVNSGTGPANVVIEVADADRLFLQAGGLMQNANSLEMMRIDSIGAAGSGTGNTTQITVDKNYGSPSGGSDAAITLTDRIRILGHHGSQAQDYRSGISTKDTKFTNYWSIITDTYEVGREFGKFTLEPNNFATPEEREKAMIRHKRNLEQSLWWATGQAGDGVPWSSTEANNTPSIMKGVWQLLRDVNNTDLIKSVTTLTEDTWMDNVEASSHYGDNNSKIAFVGSKVATGFDKWSISRKFESVTDEFTGAKVFKWYSSFYPNGLPIVHTEALGSGAFGSGNDDWIFILDMSKLTFYYLEGEDTHEDLGPNGTGLQDNKSRKFMGAFSTMCSITLKGTDRAHMVMKDISSVT